MISFPSFRVIPIIAGTCDFSAIEDRIGALSARNCRERLRYGTLPESLKTLDGVITFKYVFEYEFAYHTLDGARKTIASQEIPIIFFEKSNLLVIGYCTKDIESRLLSFIQDNFVPGYTLEPIGFEESVLRSVIDHCPDVSQADVEPRGGGRGFEHIDRISCIGREITDSEFWEEYGGELLAKVKVTITEIPEEARVAFSKKGVITLYNRSFDMEQQVLVLKHILEKLVVPLVRSRSIQERLSG